jgi:hypothetical protein
MLHGIPDVARPETKGLHAADLHSSVRPYHRAVDRILERIDLRVFNCSCARGMHRYIANLANRRG